MTFRRLASEEIDQISPEGGWLALKNPKIWVQIIQLTPDKINYKHYQDLFEFYLIGDDENGYLQLPVRKATPEGG